MRNFSSRRGSAWSPASLALLAAIGGAALLASGGAAQEAASDTATVSGRVMLGGEPVAGIPVILHRVSSDASGAVGSQLTDESGSFRFTVDRSGDPAAAVYFATAEHLSVRYFGRPVRLDNGLTDYIVAVHDTVQVPRQPIRIARRDLFLLPEAGGSWDVNELIQVLNPGDEAVVGAPGGPSWSFRVPPGASDFEAGEADILPHEVTLMGDRIVFLTPVTPGSRTLLIRYRLTSDSRQAELLVGEPTDTFNVFVPLPSHLTSLTGVTPRQPLIEVEGEQFLRYEALGVAPGHRIDFAWRRPEGPPVDPIVAAVVVTVALLGIAIVAAVRNRGAMG